MLVFAVVHIKLFIDKTQFSETKILVWLHLKIKNKLNCSKFNSIYGLYFLDRSTVGRSAPLACTFFVKINLKKCCHMSCTRPLILQQAFPI